MDIGSGRDGAAVRRASRGLRALTGAGLVVFLVLVGADQQAASAHTEDDQGKTAAEIAAERAWTADGRIGPADGYIAEGETVSLFDGSSSAVTRLDPALREALYDAAAQAQKDAGLSLRVAGGWRSAALQQWLIDQADEGEADERRAESALYRAGGAVDLGDAEAYEWLGSEGAAFGVCQTRADEPWHFEYVPEAVTQGCPAPVVADEGEEGTW